MQKVPKLGELLKGDEKRDAIHIAIAPVVAGQKLLPGQDIGFINPGDYQTVGTVTIDKCIGIVDPFLETLIFQNDEFYMCLYPETIKSLRHDWTHPAFSENEMLTPDEEHVPWLRYGNAIEYFKNMAEKVGITDTNLIQYIGDCIDGGECYVEYGSTGLQDTYFRDEDLFWNNYEIVTNKLVDGTDRNIPFSCSC